MWDWARQKQEPEEEGKADFRMWDGGSSWFSCELSFSEADSLKVTSKAFSLRGLGREWHQSGLSHQGIQRMTGESLDIREFLGDRRKVESSLGEAGWLEPPLHPCWSHAPGELTRHKEPREEGHLGKLRAPCSPDTRVTTPPCGK